MQCLGRGLDRIITCLPRYLRIVGLSQDGQQEDSPIPTTLFPDSWAKAIGRTGNWGSLLHENAAIARRAIAYRPYIAAFLYFDGHWCASIFDRKHATLVFFDSLKNGRETRARAAGAYWREMLTTLGFPYPFAVVVPGIKGQTNDYVCGYVAIWHLFQSVRGSADTYIGDLQLPDPEILDGTITNEMYQELTDRYASCDVPLAQTPSDYVVLLHTMRLAHLELGLAELSIHCDSTGKARTYKYETVVRGLERAKVRPLGRNYKPHLFTWDYRLKLDYPSLKDVYCSRPDIYTVEFRRMLGLLSKNEEEALRAQAQAAAILIDDSPARETTTSRKSHDQMVLSTPKGARTPSAVPTTPRGRRMSFEGTGTITPQARQPTPTTPMSINLQGNQATPSNARSPSAQVTSGQASPLPGKGELSVYHTVVAVKTPQSYTKVSISDSQKVKFHEDHFHQRVLPLGVIKNVMGGSCGITALSDPKRAVEYDEHSGTYMSTRMKGHISPAFWDRIMEATQAKFAPPLPLSRAERYAQRNLPSDQKVTRPPGLIPFQGLSPMSNYNPKGKLSGSDSVASLTSDLTELSIGTMDKLARETGLGSPAVGKSSDQKEGSWGMAPSTPKARQRTDVGFDEWLGAHHSGAVTRTARRQLRNRWGDETMGQVSRGRDTRWFGATDDGSHDEEDEDEDDE
jgi:hypothetical protein